MSRTKRCMTSVAMPYTKGLLSPILALFPTEKSNVRRPLSFHAVSFGQDSTSSSLRTMAQIALEVQYAAPHDPLLPAAANIPSSYMEALDTVNWSNSFWLH